MLLQKLFDYLWYYIGIKTCMINDESKQYLMIGDFFLLIYICMQVILQIFAHDDKDGLYYEINLCW